MSDLVDIPNCWFSDTAAHLQSYSTLTFLFFTVIRYNHQRSVHPKDRSFVRRTCRSKIQIVVYRLLVFYTIFIEKISSPDKLCIW